jgi:hypothetical protein
MVNPAFRMRPARVSHASENKHPRLAAGYATASRSTRHRLRAVLDIREVQRRFEAVSEPGDIIIGPKMHEE